MTSIYDNTKPDWTPGSLGRDASELAKITASPAGWIYTFTPIAKYPTAATWATNVVTMTHTNHGLETGDIITVTGMTPADYNATGVTVTKLTENTFTYPKVVSDPGAGTVMGAFAYTTSRNVELLTALRQLDSKQTAETDTASVPTFTAQFSASAHTGGTLSTVSVGVGGSGYGISTDPVACTVAAPTTPGGVTALVHGVANAGGVITSFVVDNAGSGYVTVPAITVLGTGTLGTGTSHMAAYNVATAAVLKVTLTPSEPVTVSGTPTILVTIDAHVRSFVYDAALSTSSSLVFKYAVVAGDAALVTTVTSGAAVTMAAAYDGIGDILAATGGTNWLSAAQTVFSAPVLTNLSVN